MIPIVSFVGKSNVGKTTFLEKVVVELKRRGYGWRRSSMNARLRHRQARQGYVAHGRGRQRRGGHLLAQQVALIARTTATWRRTKSRQSRHGRRHNPYRGYKRGDKPKIEISRREKGRTCSVARRSCWPSPRPALCHDVPQFSLDDAGGVCDLLVEK